MHPGAWTEQSQVVVETVTKSTTTQKYAAMQQKAAGSDATKVFYHFRLCVEMNPSVKECARFYCNGYRDPNIILTLTYLDTVCQKYRRNVRSFSFGSTFHITFIYYLRVLSCA